MNTSLMAFLARGARASGLIALAVISILATGCFPDPVADDEGHASFAREAFPVLLGRRPHGVDEVELVADVAQLLGRETAVKMLMKDTEYVDHWADVLVDLLEMQRQRDGGIGVAQDNACWGEPTRANPDPVIAEWVRDNGPKAAGGPSPAWNMTDLLRSAILIDDLSPVYRANLFTTSMRRAGSNNGRRTELTNYLLRVYLNRDTGCLGCHNPEKSTSNVVDPGSGDMLWRRLWNIPGHPEKALFGNYLDGNSAFARITPIMRGDVRRLDGPGFGIRPWGMSADCATDTSSDSPSNNGTLTHEGFQNVPGDAGNNAGAGFGSLDGGLNGKLSLWELEQALHGGVFNLKDGYERFAATSVNHPPGSDEQKYCGFVEALPNCTGCHNADILAGGMDLSGNDPGAVVINVDTGASSVNAKRVVPGNLGASEVWLNITENMGNLPPAQRDGVEGWITASAPDPGDAAICNTSDIPDVHPDEAFAFLTAANLVDGIFESVMGYPLTIDHGFPRNSKQLHMLWNLTEYEFVPKDWSLKAVLGKIMSSNWFARRAPNLSQEGSAYELPPVLDPWVVANPVEVSNPPAHQRNNGQGELVDVYRVNTLLRNVADALGWREPRRFPGGGYPSPLDQDLGQFLSPGRPGFDGVNFQSLLALETGIGANGLCAKAGRAVDADDWIDTLVTAIADHNSASPDAPVTVGEAWALLKDRLIQDTTIERRLPSGLSSVDGALTEEQAMLAFFRQGTDAGLTHNSATSALSTAQLENKLREGCNIVMKSPEFMLTNITPRGYSDNNMPDPPRLAVCLPGESCGYPQICGKWRGVLSGMGHQTICEDRTIRTGTWFIYPGLISDVLFPVELQIGKLNPKSKLEFVPVPPQQRFGAMLPNPGAVDTSPQASRSISLSANRMMSVDPKAGKAGQKKPLPQRDTGIRINLLKDLKVQDLSGKEVKLKGMSRVRQRLASLCLDGMCGFVPRGDMRQCLADAPAPGACNGLRSMCDPRCSDGDNCCGGRIADASETGFLSIWAEGSVVRDARRVRMLRLGDKRWRPLDPGTRLNAGDLLDVPAPGRIAIQSGNVLYGDTPIKAGDPRIAAAARQVLAVTGPSASKLLARPTKFRALSPAAVAAGTRSGRYLSHGFVKGDYARLKRAQVLPGNKYVPTLEEVWKMNQDFDRLHFPKDSGLTPSGSALPEN